MATSWDWNNIAQNWATSMASPTTQQNFKAGVMRQTVSPTQLAATPEAEQRYQDGVAASIASGKRQRALQAVSLTDYQQAAVAKASNLGQGAKLAQSKYAKAMQPYSSVYNAIKSKLANMPKGGYANARARSDVAIEELMRAAGTL